MSDASEKVLGIKHLPLFPLPLVLLPNEILPLHIFEPRYQKLFKDIALEKNIFGVTLFDPQESFIDKPIVGSIGCAAEVRESQALPDGRSNILTHGLLRYRLLEYVDAGEPYLIGDVEFFEDEPQNPVELNLLTDEVYNLFVRVAKAAHQMSGRQNPFPEIPRADAEHLSFVVTAAFNLENNLKYEFLEMRSTVERLERLRGILLQAVGTMEESAAIQKAAQSNGHSKKKIDV